MKNNLVRVSILILGAAAGASSQAVHRLNADVPFNFTVSNTVMPAGHYVVDQSSVQGVLVLHEADSRRNAMVKGVRVETRTAQQNAKLVFRRYGDQYFLAEVWNPALGIGHQIAP